MITTSLRVNELGVSATEWYIGEYLAAMDALDVGRYSNFLADGVSVQFNNAPAVEGKAAVTAMLAEYWQSFAAIEHEPLNIYGSDDHFMLEALNHYVRHDGRKVTTRAVALTDRDAQGKVTSVRIYADASPVFES
ncbi:nuclear transport factor 2 family protein [Sphingomonas ursincola]|uniref:Nuclear transport factor 2 family protein n=1 Tax=Sphingomonas ursincola TaxID=56361 RepID=A0A7V8RGB7_9SPHN|nr:nuclear transport factor 2 family protein [Sphingomonas ursincola]MBA1375887.1 nuclear transport factor 2 family protein [Sphingomonas ursincola]